MSSHIMRSISRRPPLPGFGLALNHNTAEGHELFPNALSSNVDERESNHRLPLTTLREIAMIQFMNQITDKTEWEHKIPDENIAQKWATEAIQSPEADFTEKMAEYCIAELKFKAEILKKKGYIRVYNGDVVKSDCAIPADLRAELKAAVAPLEQVPVYKKDWHPGSDDKVLDLVHPSLFPLVYGTSRILTGRTVGLDDCVILCGQGNVVPVLPEQKSYTRLWEPQCLVCSNKFQWLPCDIDVSGETPRIVSYINNLHPREHVHLYEIIEKCLGKILPLWNATLTPLRAMDWKRRIVYNAVDYGELDAYMEREGPRRLENESEEDFDVRQEDWRWDHKRDFIVKPNPGTFSRDDQIHDGENGDEGYETKKKESQVGTVDLKRDYVDTGIQVIVKLANIHLTPEKPAYDGGTWHIEGQLNEQICATAIYYYDIENTTPSHLAFRQPSDALWAEEHISYAQSDREWLECIYGLSSDEPAIQLVGSIQAREGRVITFPNILQHQVQPFKLADPTKPGHRKILAFFFLVDPNVKIISTANIPCQQREWWGEMVMASDGVLEKLPAELKEKVVKEVDGFPLSLEQAKKIREQLMDERKNFVLGDPTMLLEQVIISLCEH